MNIMSVEAAAYQKPSPRTNAIKIWKKLQIPPEYAIFKEEKQAKKQQYFENGGHRNE